MHGPRGGLDVAATAVRCLDARRERFEIAGCGGWRQNTLPTDQGHVLDQQILQSSVTRGRKACLAGQK